MRLRDIFITANANLGKAKLRTFLTIFAVFIGATTLMLTNSVGIGVKQYIDKQIAGVGSEDTLFISKQSDDQAPDDALHEYDASRKGAAISQFSQADLDDIKKIENIKSIDTLPNATLEYIQIGDKKYTGIISSFPEGVRVDIATGKDLNEEGAGDVLLPSCYVPAFSVASQEEVVGKTITVAVRNAVSSEVQTFEAKVSGISNGNLISGSFIIARSSLMRTLADAQNKGLRNADPIYGVTAELQSDLSSSQLQKVKDDLSKFGSKGETFEDQYKTVSSVIQGIQLGLNVFGAIALAAASFGIINTLLMAINERTREIGLMKALGMSRGKIFLLFSFEAILIGLWGSAFGVVAALGISKLGNNYLSTLSFFKNFEGLTLSVFTVPSVLSIVALIVVIAFIAGALPSWRAARQDPIVALRYE